MDEAIGGRPFITAPVLIASASQDAVVPSPPSNNKSRGRRRRSRRRVETPVMQRRVEALQCLREVWERQEE